MSRRRPEAEFLTDAQALKENLKGKTLVVIGSPGENAWLSDRWDGLNLPAHLVQFFFARTQNGQVQGPLQTRNLADIAVVFRLRIV